MKKTTTQRTPAAAARGVAPDAAKAILNRLKKEYGDSEIGLTYQNPFELLISTILSAQCTDERVNKVTPILFARYRTAEDFASAKQEELEEYIRSTGFYHAKAKSILGAAIAIMERFGGKIPATMEDLVSLPGVGRKTANVVLSYAFGTPVGVVVDTHVGRLAQRLGFTRQTDPEKIEQDLVKLFPKKEWSAVDTCLIWHGRKVCSARKPDCEGCVVSNLCPSAFSIH